MTNDYSALKLTASSNPHIRAEEGTRSVMLDVIIGLMPALIMSVYVFGPRTLVAAIISVLGSVFFEWGYRKLLHKPQTVGDLSAVVTGLLMAMVCSSLLPYWMLLVGDFFAIVVVKQLYGGLGKNFLNPALAGRAALSACYAAGMTAWAKPFQWAPIFGSIADVETYATPMTLMKVGGLEGVSEVYSLKDMLFGFVGGSMGEISSLMLLFGGLFLIFRRVISWHIPVSFLGTIAVLTFLFPQGNDPLTFMLYQVLGGGAVLNAFFMATDYVTSPVTKKGQLIYGACCGLITVFIRYFGAFSEGACYSILVMNCCVWLIDKYAKPTRFGVEKKKKEAAQK